MNKQRKIDLQRTIIELEKPYPKDDFILTYAHFLKHRDYLPYYQFNPVVFDNLANLTNTIWNKNLRISRLSLLKKIKLYYQYHTIRENNNSSKTPITLKLETRKSLFNLFIKTFKESNCISHKQLDEARKICNNVLIKLQFTPIEEEWLCTHVNESVLILNRVLRYPVTSDVISNWAKRNFKNDTLRSRRAELLSWIIDQEPTYVIEQQILIDDFEYLNQSDMQAIQKYDDEVTAQKIVEYELSAFLSKKTGDDLLESTYNGADNDAFIPELKLSKRSYAVPIDLSKHYPVSIPDFKKLRDDFYVNLPMHQKLTMIWAIAYSRLNNTLKYDLLKSYYSNETYYSMYKVCKKTKNIELLKWILEQQ